MKLNPSVIQIIKFGIVGVTATLVHMTMALLMNELVGISPLWSNLIAFLTAFPVSYLGNYYWTFNTKTSHRKSMPRFAVSSVSGLTLSQIIVWFVAEYLGYSLRVALVPALLIVPIFSFVISRLWVFPGEKIVVAE